MPISECPTLLVGPMPPQTNSHSWSPCKLEDLFVEDFSSPQLMSEPQLIALALTPPQPPSQLKPEPQTSQLEPTVNHVVPLHSNSIHYTTPPHWNMMLPSSLFHLLSMSMACPLKSLLLPQILLNFPLPDKPYMLLDGVLLQLVDLLQITSSLLDSHIKLSILVFRPMDLSLLVFKFALVELSDKILAKEIVEALSSLLPPQITQLMPLSLVLFLLEEMHVLSMNLEYIPMFPDLLLLTFKASSINQLQEFHHQELLLHHPELLLPHRK